MSHVIPRGKGGHCWPGHSAGSGSGRQAALRLVHGLGAGLHSRLLTAPQTWAFVLAGSALAVRSCGCKQLRGPLFCYRHNTHPATPVKLQWLSRNSVSSEPRAAIRPCPQAPAHGPRFRCLCLAGSHWVVSSSVTQSGDPFGNQGALGLPGCWRPPWPCGL